MCIRDRVSSVQGFRTDEEGLDGRSGDAGQVVLQGLLFSVEMGAVSWPDTKHDLETSVFGSRTQDLQGVTVRDGVGLDDLGVASDVLQVGGVLIGGFTVSGVVLDT